jgi:hypothetical protein
MLFYADISNFLKKELGEGEDQVLHQYLVFQFRYVWYSFGELT